MHSASASGSLQSLAIALTELISSAKPLRERSLQNSPVTAAMRCLSAARVQHAILTHRLSLKGRVAPHELAVAGAGAGDPAAAAFPAP